MYVGHLLPLDRSTILRLLSSVGHAFHCDARGLPPDGSSGDPVFFLDVADAAPAVHAHACISWHEQTPIAYAWARYGPHLGAASEAELSARLAPDPNCPAREPIALSVFQDVTPVAPPLVLSTIDIAVPDPKISCSIEPEDVLRILAALPAGARTPWAQRVVARNNEISGWRWPPGTAPVELDAARYSRDAVAALSQKDREFRSRELESLLSARLWGPASLEVFRARLAALVEELERLGYRPVQWDYDLGSHGRERYTVHAAPDELLLSLVLTDAVGIPTAGLRLRLGCTL